MYMYMHSMYYMYKEVDFAIRLIFDYMNRFSSKVTCSNTKRIIMVNYNLTLIFVKI